MIVGQLKSLEAFFGRSEQLGGLYRYLLACVTAGSAENARILGLDSAKNPHESSFILSEKGGLIRAIEQSYLLKNEPFFESHRKFVDFQLCVSGAEFMEVGDSAGFKVIKEYDKEKDLVVYEKICAFDDCGDSTPTTKILMTPGTLAIFFPNDTHAGGLRCDLQNSAVFKSVVKVGVELLKPTL